MKDTLKCPVCPTRIQRLEPSSTYMTNARKYARALNQSTTDEQLRGPLGGAIAHWAACHHDIDLMDYMRRFDR